MVTISDLRAEQREQRARLEHLEKTVDKQLPEMWAQIRAGSEKDAISVGTKIAYGTVATALAAGGAILAKFL